MSIAASDFAFAEASSDTAAAALFTVEKSPLVKALVT